MKKIVISGYYGFGNAGDELVLQEMLNQIRKNNPETKITVLSADPKDTAKKYNVKAVNRWSILAVLRAIITCDILISGGGSLLQDKTSKNGILYYLGIILTGILSGKKTCIFSQGIGPVDDSRNRRLTKWILSRVSYLSVRDRESKEYIRSLSVDREVIVAADPVFLMEQVPESEIRETKSGLGIPETKKLVMVSLRQWDNDKQTVGSIREFLDGFDQENYAIRIIGLHYPQDIEFLKNEGFFESRKEWMLDKKLTEQQVAALIAGSHCVVAMRLHALIVAAAQKVEDIIAISYDPKVTTLDKDMYKDSFQITTTDVSPERLTEKLNDIKKKTAPLSEWKERAALSFIDLNKIISGSAQQQSQEKS